MRAFLAAAIASGLLTLSSCAATAPPAVFIKLENDWVAALQAHDTAALDRLLDDTFVDTTFRGTLRSKPEVLAGPPAGAGYHTLRLDDLLVRTYGGAMAVVTGINVLQGTASDDIVRVRFTDVFVKRNGHWRAVSAQETLQSPVEVKAPGGG